MRISDWSSDVCSSDLGCDGGGVAQRLVPHRRHVRARRRRRLVLRRPPEGRDPPARREHLVLGGRGRDPRPSRRARGRGGGGAERAHRGRGAGGAGPGQIGRASCRERVCQYVSISVVAVSLRHKKISSTPIAYTSTIKYNNNNT